MAKFTSEIELKLTREGLQEALDEYVNDRLGSYSGNPSYRVSKMEMHPTGKKHAITLTVERVPEEVTDEPPE